MQRKPFQQNSSILNGKAPPPRDLFNDISNYQSDIQYRSARNSIEVIDPNTKHKNSPQSIVYFTIKSNQKKHPQKKISHQRIKSQLPFINEHLKSHRLTKYFNRFDIVKDRAEQKSYQIHSDLIDNSISRIVQDNNKNENLKDRNLSHFGPIKINNKAKFHALIGNTTRTRKNSIITNQQSSQNQSLVCLRKNLDKSQIQQRTRLQDEMRDWQIIKRKNQFQVYKMKRKNDLQRMRSNFMIAQALNELIGKREKVLLDEKFLWFDAKFQSNNL